MMVYNDNMMQMILISAYVGLNGSLSITWSFLLIKSELTKSANCRKPMSSLLSFITLCYLVKYGKYLRLFTFNIWIKSRMGNRCQWIWGVSWGLLGLWSTSWPSLCWSFHVRVIFLLPLCCVRLSYGINRDVRDTVMILYVICRLMCVTDPWAHMSFMHSILSLKLGVTTVT